MESRKKWLSLRKLQSTHPMEILSPAPVKLLFTTSFATSTPNKAPFPVNWTNET